MIQHSYYTIIGPGRGLNWFQVQKLAVEISPQYFHCPSMPGIKIMVYSSNRIYNI